MESKHSTLFIVAVLSFAEISSTFELSMSYAALSTMTREYGDAIAVGWTMTAFFLVSAVSAAICGRLGDMYGRKTVLCIILTLAAVGSLVSASTNNLHIVILGRAIQGVTGALLPLCLGLVREYLPEDKVAAATGILGATASIGVGTGFFIGGFIVDNWTWHAIFYFSAFLAIIGLIGVSLLPPSISYKQKEKLDILGGVLFMPAIAGLLYGFGKAKSVGWSDPPTLALIAASIALLIFWCWYELRQKVPLINIRLLFNRQIIGAILTYGLIALTSSSIKQIFGMLMQQPAWTGIGLGLSASVTSLFLFTSTIAALCVGPISGRMTRDFGVRRMIITGSFLAIIGWCMAYAYNSNAYVISMIVFLIGLGSVIILIASNVVMVHEAPRDRVSELVGMNSVLRSIITAIGLQVIAISIASPIVYDSENPKHFYPAPEAYNKTFIILIATSFICLALTQLMRKDVNPFRLFGGKSEPSST